jgi:hypothetical protein
MQGNSQKLDATNRIGAEFAERFRSGGNEFPVIENREFIPPNREIREFQPDPERRLSGGIHPILWPAPLAKRRLIRGAPR